MGRMSLLATVIFLAALFPDDGLTSDDIEGTSSTVVFEKIVELEATRLRRRIWRPAPTTTNPTRSTQQVAQRNAVAKWNIPAGHFGLILHEGNRIVGKPAKGWGATIKTVFGTVTIPLTQIRRIDSLKTGGVAITLINGDRVSGTLTSKTLKFVTQFGTLTVPSSDILALSTTGKAPAGGAFPVNVVGTWEAKFELDAAKMGKFGGPGSGLRGPLSELARMKFRLHFDKNGGTTMSMVNGPGKEMPAQSGKWKTVSKSGNTVKIRFSVQNGPKPEYEVTLKFRDKDHMDFDSADPEFRKAPIKLPLRFKRVK